MLCSLHQSVVPNSGQLALLIQLISTCTLILLVNTVSTVNIVIHALVFFGGGGLIANFLADKGVSCLILFHVVSDE